MCAGFHRVRWALPAFVLWCAAAPPSAAAASTVGEEPQARRIVSLAPSVTETLFALGAGDAVVGISTYCDYPPAATIFFMLVGQWFHAIWRVIRVQVKD